MRIVTAILIIALILVSSISAKKMKATRSCIEDTNFQIRQAKMFAGGQYDEMEIALSNLEYIECSSN